MLDLLQLDSGILFGDFLKFEKRGDFVPHLPDGFPLHFAQSVEIEILAIVTLSTLFR